ncbi:sodium- and chloride-dependent neutral and basic amino acid transporter B(0+)-like [Bicyclus anynana]|uniref:Sodium- and chloride-dependent neutral and basic amino acid transporter B(0+)-like n=1 Tax=Bicyclus anynana TaxID=110368 RepID=A0ABM3M6X8_BICAN|nr:sodium- and chloride-dependent neutral and basic amino acid transporter B(0+)-like [Bicyclus anynana]
MESKIWVIILVLKLQDALSWRSIQPYLCTLAVSLSFGTSWRAPRDAFRYGAVTSALVTTVAAALVALPAALLQLSVGQLSQQDAVGIWRAVPFFKGIGFLRLLISFLSALYTVVYTSITITYIFHTISNPIVKTDCSEHLDPQVNHINIHHSSNCLNETFLAPIGEQPEYYIALASIVIALWILFPFILYNPVKLMKRIMYAFGFLVLLLGIIIISYVGNKDDVPSMVNSSDWVNFVRPNIWHSAVVQALVSNQIAGGYLISSGDSIYANTNVQWTTLSLVGANILFGWAGILFWFAVGGTGQKETNNLAVIVQIYKTSAEKDLGTVWSILMLAMLSFSGMITMLALLYPLYDRFRRVGGHKWRHLSMGSSVVGAAAALAVLIVGHSALALFEDVVVPCLVSVTTVVEISAFVFIYGWKVLVEDIEFLLGSKLPKCWVWGWCSVPGIVTPLTLWWIVVSFIDQPDWLQAPWEKAGIVTSLSGALVLFLVFAAISVAKQVQYDFVGKLKSSFRPSRHWGPRDPITHHYWLARREEGDRNAPRARFRRQQLGEFSGISSFSNIRTQKTNQDKCVNRIRSKSDDFNISRRKFIAELNHNRLDSRKRWKSLEWDAALRHTQIFPDIKDILTSADIKPSEHGNNIVKDGLE